MSFSKLMLKAHVQLSSVAHYLRVYSRTFCQKEGPEAKPNGKWLYTYDPPQGDRVSVLCLCGC